MAQAARVSSFLGDGGSHTCDRKYSVRPLSAAGGTISIRQTDLVAGAQSPAVGDGVYLMVKPLRLGRHTIHFTGEAPAFNFFLDIAYRVTVVAHE